MIVQFNTGNNIIGSEQMNERLGDLIKSKLDRFSEQITRIEAHLTDTNGKKEGQDDKQCVLEARLEGIQPIAVSHAASNYDEAVSGAITKLKSSLDSTLGKLRNH